ncbi:HD-GYP domain-containing protein [Candidatus Dependentiae bacterium]|nr:HD-GYP domain-containing protein [Candidatus Dependentiae bacterium]
MRPANIFNVIPGVKLARPVYNSEANILLNKNSVLSEKYIERIKNIGVRTIFIEDEISDGIFINDVICEENRVEAVKFIRKLLKFCEAVKEPHKIKLDLDNLFAIVKKLVDDLWLNKSKVFTPSIDVKNAENYTAAHSVNTAIISMVIGLGLQWTKEDIIELGIGAILHDVGKTKIPNSILDKPGRLTNEEYDIIKTHSEHGYKILKNIQNLSEDILFVSWQHHEKVNGQGYPEGLTEKDILENAKIVALADVFDALTSDRVYKNRMPADMAIKIILGASGSHFSSIYTSVFDNYAQMYPPGSIVQLTNGMLGIVLSYKNKTNYKLRIFTDENKKKLDTFLIMDMSKEKKLRIIKTLDDLHYT